MFEIMSRYKNEGTVFLSPRRGAKYYISSADDSTCVVERLDATQPVTITDHLVQKKIDIIRENDGRYEFMDLDTTTAIKTVILQAPQFGLSSDQNEIIDLSDEQEAVSAFCDIVKNLHVHRANGRPTLYKPAMVACVVEALDNAEINDNQIDFDWIAPQFIEKMSSLGVEATTENAAKPFFHLTNDLFWMLSYNDPKNTLNTGTATPASIRRDVRHATIKDTYWHILQRSENRRKILNALAEKWWPEHNEYAEGNSMNEIITKFGKSLKKAGLHYENFLIQRFIASCLTKRFVILTGLSGSGKTKLAQAFAKWITVPSNYQSDPFKKGTEVSSDRITYHVKASDRISVEFWNSLDDNATRVVLPRDLIDEWVHCIDINGFDATTQARQIRETVKDRTNFSPQLNSFETHLKAAAFHIKNTFAETSETPSYEVVSVGADWISNENILGYADALNSTQYVTTRVLDLILSADKNPRKPHFLILDEMNLSHVERYFADMLSAIESNEPILLHTDKDKDGLPISRDGIPSKIELPENLFIIGTVNVDETTYMFSPKVLDRANVIEFRVEENAMKNFLKSPQPVQMEELQGEGKEFGELLVEAASKRHDLSELNEGEEIKEQLQKILLDIFKELSMIGAEFGYRSAMEITKFFCCFHNISGEEWRFENALDAQIVQKMLPRLHGSTTKLMPVLDALLAICDKQSCPVSKEKIERMKKQLELNGFTSFAEA